MYIDYKVLGSRIKKYRISKDLTQQQLSELINKTPEYICKIEKGKATPSLEVLAAICHFLSADIGFILTGTDYDSKKYLKEDIASKFSDCTPEQMKLINELTDNILKYKINVSK